MVSSMRLQVFPEGLLSSRRILSWAPRISIKDELAGQLRYLNIGPARYLIPVGATINVFQTIRDVCGDVIAKIPRETTKTKDITGGLPRVAELLKPESQRNAPL